MSKIDYKDHIYALIMAGGGGTRLWPRSREQTPKQFLKLFAGRTLMEMTADRLSKFLAWDKIFVSTATNDYAKRIRKLIPQLRDDNIIIEPVRRDSGPAHALGTAYIFKKDKDAVIINAATDHLVHPETNYKRVMFAAAHTAYKDD